MIQHALSTTPGDEALRVEETTLLARLAPLALFEDDRLRWQWGFLRSAVLCEPHFPTHKRPTTLTLLEQLLALPVAACLHSLQVLAKTGHELDRVAETLAKFHPPALRELGIYERFPDNDDMAQGLAFTRTAALWSLPLERLGLCAGKLGFGTQPIDAPALRRISFEGGIKLAALADARWPQLTAFSATHGRYVFGSYGEPGTFHGDALCEVIAGAAWGARLVELSLCECAITDAGAHRLFALEGLQELDLDGNEELSDATRAELTARWPPRPERG